MAHSDPHASRFSLKRAQHQRIALQKIEARPIEVGKRHENQRRHVGGIGNPVAFARKQARQLLPHFLIKKISADG